MTADKEDSAAYYNLRQQIDDLARWATLEELRILVTLLRLFVSAREREEKEKTS